MECGAELLLALRLSFSCSYINAHHFDFIAVAQRTTPRSNETQSPDEESTSATSNGQNLNREVTNTPTVNTPTIPVKYLQNLGLQEKI